MCQVQKAERNLPNTIGWLPLNIVKKKCIYKYDKNWPPNQLGVD
jgi:hypothetical protein